MPVPVWAWALLVLGAVSTAALYAIGHPIGEASLAQRRVFEFAVELLCAGVFTCVMHATRGFGTAEKPAPWYAAAMPIVLVLVIFAFRVASLTFLADDFFELVFVAGSHGVYWAPQPNWHHYFPLGLELMALPLRVWGWSAVWFHLHNLIALALLAMAATVLAAQAGVERDDLPLVALLLLAFPLNASAVFWIAIVKFTYAALFAALALYGFRAFVRGNGPWTLACCGLATAASMLCIEQGAAIAPMCFVIAWLDRRLITQWPRRQIACALAVPVVIVLALLFVKASAGGAAAYGGMSPRVMLQTSSAYGWSLLTPGSSAGLQIGLTLAHRGTAILLGSVFVLLALGAVLFRFGSPAFRFGLAWAVISGVPVVLGAPGVVSRYYALPAVGVAIALAAWASQAPAGQRFARQCALVVVFAAGMWWTLRWSQDFRRASDITQKVHEGIVEHVLPTTSYGAIALVDLPSHVGKGDWPATVFATGGRVLVGITRSDYDLEAIRAIRIWRTTPDARYGTESEYVTPQALAAAAADPDQVVLRWEGLNRGLVRMQPESP